MKQYTLCDDSECYSKHQHVEIASDVYTCLKIIGEYRQRLAEIVKEHWRLNK